MFTFVSFEIAFVSTLNFVRTKISKNFKSKSNDKILQRINRREPLCATPLFYRTFLLDDSVPLLTLIRES